MLPSNTARAIDVESLKKQTPPSTIAGHPPPVFLPLGSFGRESSHETRKFSADFSVSSLEQWSRCLKAISPLSDNSTSSYIRETNPWGSWRNWQTRQVEGLVGVKSRAGSNPVEPIEDAAHGKTLRVSAGFVASHFSFATPCSALLATKLATFEAALL